MIINNLNEILTSFSRKKILVIGDIMLDRFVYGEATRISPESPVPVLSLTRENKMLGGAGNTLSSLHGLHCDANIITLVGDDSEAGLVRAQLESLGILAEGLLTVKDRPTTVKTRYLAGHQQLLRTDFEKTIPVSDSDKANILAMAKSAIPNMGCVILSDYGKGMLTEDLTHSLIKLCREHNVPVLVDPKGYDYSKYKGATALTPNKKELHDATKMPVNSDNAVIEAAQSLIDNHDLEAVIATRSKEGMSVIQKNQETGQYERPVHFQSIDLEVFDVSGAGDVVIATLAAAIATGASMQDAAFIANIAGGIAVSKVGTTPIRLDELKNTLADHDTSGPFKRTTQSSSYKTLHGPICDWDQAYEITQRWRAKGFKIGMTNGCFDVLHAGHVSLIAAAREKCDRLILALNCDASIRRLKGESRPVNDEQARGEVMSALGAVDMVVFFGQTEEEKDEPIKLFKKLMPDIIFKGGDYVPETVVGHDVVKSYGGKIEIVSFKDGHSTTGILNHLKNHKAA